MNDVSQQFGRSPDIPLTAMSWAEFDETIKALNLTQVAVGRIFRNPGASFASGERMARRWASGRSGVPPGVALALRLMLALNYNPYPLIAQVYDKPQSTTDRPKGGLSPRTTHAGVTPKSRGRVPPHQKQKEA